MYAMASLECECTDIEGHNKKSGPTNLKTEDDINRYQYVEKSSTVNDLQETFPSPSIKVQSYEDYEISGQETNSQNALTADDGINQYQEAKNLTELQDIKETTPIHSNEETTCECTDFERPQNAVTAKVDINKYQEEVNPAVAEDLKESFPSHANKKSTNECNDVEESTRQRIKVTDDVDVNKYEERMKPTAEQGLKETFAIHENQMNPPENTKIEGVNNFSQNTVMAEIDSWYQEAVNLPVGRGLVETNPIHAKQENSYKYTDIEEPKKFTTNTVTAEDDINRSQEAIKPITVHKVRKTVPGCAKRELLEYTDYEIPKNYAQNTASAGYNFNRYEKPRASTEYDQKQTWHSFVKQDEEDEQDEFFDVEGFECYEPNTVTPRHHLNRFQEAKKSPTIQGLLKHLSNRNLKQGNRAKYSEESKPRQSSVLGKSNNNVHAIFSSYAGESHQREGLRTSGGASVVTLHGHPVATPFEQCRMVRLKLENKAKGKHEPEAVKEAKAGIEEVFQSTEADLDLEEDSEQGARERNEKHLDEIFDGIERKIRLLRIEVKKKFRTLTPKQKREVLKFWEGVEEFIDLLLDWISKMFIKVLEDIRQGYIVEKREIKKVFEDVSGFLKIIF